MLESMTTEDAARKIVEIIKKPILSCIDEIIETRCYIVVLHMLEKIKEPKDA